MIKSTPSENSDGVFFLSSAFSNWQRIVPLLKVKKVKKTLQKSFY